MIFEIPLHQRTQIVNICNSVVIHDIDTKSDVINSLLLVNGLSIFNFVLPPLLVFEHLQMSDYLFGCDFFFVSFSQHRSY
mmetsp:Transcript_14205/g.21521  ORF Transcript_14205/g.21521 Transcript_14205/m.21521 type:complete len:80 (+) Transcript_14205:3-242(+)